MTTLESHELRTPLQSHGENGRSPLGVGQKTFRKSALCKIQSVLQPTQSVGARSETDPPQRIHIGDGVALKSASRILPAHATWNRILSDASGFVPSILSVLTMSSRLGSANLCVVRSQ
jgi:hypothetical protein